MINKTYRKKYTEKSQNNVNEETEIDRSNEYLNEDDGRNYCKKQRIEN